jgi:hypothetical protein
MGRTGKPMRVRSLERAAKHRRSTRARLASSTSRCSPAQHLTSWQFLQPAEAGTTCDPPEGCSVLRPARDRIAVRATALSRLTRWKWPLPVLAQRPCLISRGSPILRIPHNRNLDLCVRAMIPSSFQNFPLQLMRCKPRRDLAKADGGVAGTSGFGGGGAPHEVRRSNKKSF